MDQRSVVVSCEHGGNAIPTPWRELFEPYQELLASHRGWDPGSAQLATTIATRLGLDPLIWGVSRLLVEPNRSVGHPALFSRVTRDLDRATKQVLLDRYYHPHRGRVRVALEDALRTSGAVLHLAIHTFTPELDGRPRSIDVAILDDPKRSHERAWANGFLERLHARRPELRLARNRPYRGWADGLTTTLRAALGELYLGIELEVSQAFPQGPPEAWRELQLDIAEACWEAGGPGTRDRGLTPQPPRRRRSGHPGSSPPARRGGRPRGRG